MRALRRRLENRIEQEDEGFKEIRMSDIGIVVKACEVAARAHREQKRKDGVTPYINHPLQVAHLLHEVAGVTDAEILAAAILHDVVEDTTMTEEDVRREFGARVAGLVMECTDDKRLEKAERKRLQVINAPHKSPGAKLIKLADKIANVGDIVKVQWPVERKKEYLEWAAQVAKGLAGVNAALDAAFVRAVEKGRHEVAG